MNTKIISLSNGYSILNGLLSGDKNIIAESAQQISTIADKTVQQDLRRVEAIQHSIVYNVWEGEANRLIEIDTNLKNLVDDEIRFITMRNLLERRPYILRPMSFQLIPMGKISRTLTLLLIRMKSI